MSCVLLLWLSVVWMAAMTSRGLMTSSRITWSLVAGSHVTRSTLVVAPRHQSPPSTIRAPAVQTAFVAVVQRVPPCRRGASMTRPRPVPRHRVELCSLTSMWSCFLLPRRRVAAAACGRALMDVERQRWTIVNSVAPLTSRRLLSAGQRQQQCSAASLHHPAHPRPLSLRSRHRHSQRHSALAAASRRRKESDWAITTRARCRRRLACDRPSRRHPRRWWRLPPAVLGRAAASPHHSWTETSRPSSLFVDPWLSAVRRRKIPVSCLAWSRINRPSTAQSNWRRIWCRLRGTLTQPIPLDFPRSVSTSPDLRIVCLLLGVRNSAHYPTTIHVTICSNSTSYSAGYTGYTFRSAVIDTRQYVNMKF